MEFLPPIASTGVKNVQSHVKSIKRWWLRCPRPETPSVQVKQQNIIGKILPSTILNVVENPIRIIQEAPVYAESDLEPFSWVSGSIQFLLPFAAAFLVVYIIVWVYQRIKDYPNRTTVSSAKPTKSEKHKKKKKAPIVETTTESVKSTSLVSVSESTSEPELRSKKRKKDKKTRDRKKKDSTASELTRKTDESKRKRSVVDTPAFPEKISEAKPVVQPREGPVSEYMSTAFENPAVQQKKVPVSDYIDLEKPVTQRKEELSISKPEKIIGIDKTKPKDEPEEGVKTAIAVSPRTAKLVEPEEGVHTATAVSPTTEKRLSIQKEPETKERLGTAVPWAQIEELAKKKDEPTEDVYTAKMPSPENAGPTATAKSTTQKTDITTATTTSSPSTGTSKTENAEAKKRPAPASSETKLEGAKKADSTPDVTKNDIKKPGSKSVESPIVAEKKKKSESKSKQKDKRKKSKPEKKSKTKDRSKPGAVSSSTPEQKRESKPEKKDDGLKAELKKSTTEPHGTPGSAKSGENKSSARSNEGTTSNLGGTKSSVSDGTLSGPERKLELNKGVKESKPKAGGKSKDGKKRKKHKKEKSGKSKEKKLEPHPISYNAQES